MRQISLVLLLVGAPFLIDCKSVTISNVSPRRNSSGEIIDAHDGTYNQWSGPGTPWYYYAMAYGGGIEKDGDGCGFSPGYGYNGIGVWRSPDLATNGTWELLTLEARTGWPTDGSYFRVHVVYQRSSNTYVMWANNDGSKLCSRSEDKGNCYMVGTSSKPEGPFLFRGATTTRYAGPGDFDLLVDEVANGAQEAYVIYTATADQHAMSIERLADNWLTSLGASTSQTPSVPQPNNVSSGKFGNVWVEAPAIFKRKDVYYALFGECCCFCQNGSGVAVYTASHPLGPWTDPQDGKSHPNPPNIACEVQPMAGCGCSNGASGSCPILSKSITKAQQNVVIPVQSSSGAVEFVWTGDMWQSALQTDRIKAHDLQYWSLLKWGRDQSTGLDMPLKMEWEDTWVLDVYSSEDAYIV